ncbi:MAG: hypothetical protein ACE5HV_13825 [Acidobacteriota bacterium]
MDPSAKTARPRLLLFGAGAASVALALIHFSARANLEVEPALRASNDLVGLSMLFAGLVTVSVAWMALSPQLLAGYAALYGIYYGGYAWVLLFAAAEWQLTAAALLMAVASLLAAYLTWTSRAEGPDNERP